MKEEMAWNEKIFIFVGLISLVILKDTERRS